MPDIDRPLTQEELARLAGLVEPQEEEDFEFQGSSTFTSMTFEGGDEGEVPDISLRPIVDDEGREIGWDLVSSQQFTFGLNVRTASSARLPERGADVSDELDAFLPPSAALDDAVEAATPERIRYLRRRNGQRVKPEWVFPPDGRQTYKPSSKKKSAHSLVGKIQVWAPDDDPKKVGPKFVGSAALVSRNAVLTAAHVVPWSDVEQKKVKALFTPAYYDGQSVFIRSDGSRTAAWCDAARGYPSHAQGDDMAVWKLREPLGQELGYFGYRTYNDDWEDMPCWRLNGYPGDLNKGQRPVRVVDFPITDDDDDGAGVELEYRADSSGGMSGGPVWGWFDKNGTPRPYIVGTHIGAEDNFLEDTHNLAAGGPALSALIKWARQNW